MDNNTHAGLDTNPLRDAAYSPATDSEGGTFQSLTALVGKSPTAGEAILQQSFDLPSLPLDLLIHGEVGRGGRIRHHSLNAVSSDDVSYSRPISDSATPNTPSPIATTPKRTFDVGQVLAPMEALPVVAALSACERERAPTPVLSRSNSRSPSNVHTFTAANLSQASKVPSWRPSSSGSVKMAKSRDLLLAHQTPSEKFQKGACPPTMNLTESKTQAWEIGVKSSNAVSVGKRDVQTGEKAADHISPPRSRITLKVSITNIYGETPNLPLPSAPSKKTPKQQCTASVIIMVLLALFFKPLLWGYRILKWVIWALFWMIGTTLLYLLLVAFIDISKSLYDRHREKYI
ncbi:unnamed protein product [Phytomonas sp. Hart1]|nr:unnamed protein product [Phytomonas sp. Hart1]|eukprot:CCW69825.1 unnamed protein product [Phytomonas sp. isolate Hart1]